MFSLFVGLIDSFLHSACNDHPLCASPSKMAWDVTDKNTHRSKALAFLEPKLYIVYEYPPFRSEGKKKRFFTENYVLHRLNLFAWEE